MNGGLGLLETMIITNVPSDAMFWESAGVDIIFIDLEYMGKNERQALVDSVKSEHSIEDVQKVKSVLKKSRLLVRINPFHSETEIEINKSIENGADIIMLPMFSTEWEVDEVIRILDQRCEFYPLIETPEALALVGKLSEKKEISGFHFGLNDLHLALKKKFMFEVMLLSEFKEAVKILSDKNLFFGIGGISMLGTGTLLSNTILSQYYSAGSKRVILSRSFKSAIDCGLDAKEEVRKIKQFYAELEGVDLKLQQKEFEDGINKIVGKPNV